MEILYTVLAIAACILLFSFAIFIHEFGHFLAARWRGLRVDAFSIGFGPVLWRKEFRGVEWRLSSIPFGGYVSIPDVDPEGTAKVQGTADSKDDNDTDGAKKWKTATPLDSIIVAVAGPMGNVVLAVVLAFVLAAVPWTRFGEIPSVIGEVMEEGPAHDAGIMPGDRVVSVGGVSVRTWTEMQTEIQISGGRQTEIGIERDGKNLALTVTPTQNAARVAYDIGVGAVEVQPVIGEVMENGPAQDAGIKPGDRVISVGGVPVRTWNAMRKEIQKSDGRRTEIKIERDGKKLILSVTPAQNEESGTYYMMARSAVNNVGVGAVAWMPARNPLRQLGWDAMAIVRVLKAFVTPKEAKAAAQAVGGPVMIAYGLYSQVRSDVWDALGFLRFLCVNLALINLLPIPVLDGSIVMIALFQIIFRRKPNEKFMGMLTTLFMYLLIAAMLFLVYRDSARLFRIHKAAAAAEENAK